MTAINVGELLTGAWVSSVGRHRERHPSHVAGLGLDPIGPWTDSGPTYGTRRTAPPGALRGWWTPDQLLGLDVGPPGVDTDEVPRLTPHLARGRELTGSVSTRTVVRTGTLSRMPVRSWLRKADRSGCSLSRLLRFGRGGSGLLESFEQVGFDRVGVERGGLSGGCLGRREVGRVGSDHRALGGLDLLASLVGGGRQAERRLVLLGSFGSARTSTRWGPEPARRRMMRPRAPRWCGRNGSFRVCGPPLSSTTSLRPKPASSASTCPRQRGRGFVRPSAVVEQSETVRPTWPSPRPRMSTSTRPSPGARREAWRALAGAGRPNAAPSRGRDAR